MIFVDIAESFVTDVDATQLERAALATLAHQNVPSDYGLSIVVSDDGLLQKLNLQFMGMDAPTDVLSFPSGQIDPDSGLPYMGDVLISYARAREQATMAGHRVQVELQLLVVHGVLHLLGHDHLEEEEKANMWQAKTEILAELGVTIDLSEH